MLPSKRLAQGAGESDVRLLRSLLPKRARDCRLGFAFLFHAFISRGCVETKMSAQVVVLRKSCIFGNFQLRAKYGCVC